MRGRIATVLVAMVATSCLLFVDTSELHRDGPADVERNDSGDREDRGDGGTTGEAGLDGAQHDGEGAIVDAGAPCPTADPTLRLCLRFEGNAVDESSQNIAPLAAGSLGFVAGIHGMAAKFTLAPQSNLVFANDDRLDGVRTIEAWINPSAASHAVIVDVHDDFELRVDTDGTVLCRKPDLVSTGKAVPGVWTHVACTLGNGDMRAYVDGVEVGTVASTNIVDNDKFTGIGQNSTDSASRYEGLIDDLRLWSEPRTPAQIAESARR